MSASVRIGADGPPPNVEGRTVVLVDDGLATGSTMRAAVEALRRQRPRQIIVAVPIARPTPAKLLAREVDRIVCAATPEPFHAVGLWYEDFSPTTDEEGEPDSWRQQEEAAEASP